MNGEGPKRGPAVRAPLFDRLFDRSPREHDDPPQHRVLERDRVVESIKLEVSRLLNTRCSGTMDDLAGQERTVLNYGLPDFAALSPTSERDRERLARLIADAVRAFEPRLRNPLVRVTSDEREGRVLRVLLEGTLVLDNLIAPVSFPLVIAERGGAIEPA
jgi:type VI secretion system lysozyme-like protein